jgi:DNA polymerase III delta subunit
MLDAGKSRREVASSLRVGPRFVDAVMDQIDRFTAADLAGLSRMLLKADITLKSSGLPSKVVLERFLVEACTGAPAAGA